MFRELIQDAELRSLFDLYPAASDRKAWERIPKDYRRRLKEEGEKQLGCDLPPIYATDFMEFCRTGNRSHYEAKLFVRRTALNTFVLAECVDDKGRFMDKIIDLIFLICEESAWQLPAHNTYIRDTPQFLLPDVTKPVIDLFAAETGATLAMAEYLLRDSLAEVSPAVSIMINHNLETRIFKPYLEEHFWWMGDGVSSMNNWTSWCTQNVLLAAFTRKLDEKRQRAVLEKACRSLDYFLEEYGEDGCCDEGAQYYRHAGLTLFNAMEVLNHITGQGFTGLYKEPKIRNIADYIRKVHVDGPYYVNFADCSPIAGRCGAREYLFGRRTDNEALMAFAAKDYREGGEDLGSEEHNLFYRVQAAFCHEEMAGYQGIEEQAKDCYFPSAGLFVARDQEFCLAVKAGDNDDSHNHNDAGSFTIYKNGIPMFIDVGVESYTKKTFSPQRYEIWTMQSQYHNLPTFGGVMEKDGENYGAREEEYVLGDKKAWIKMELAGAYGDERIKSYIREVYMEKGKYISVRDVYKGELKPAVLSLMTYEKPEIIWEMTEAGENGELRMAIGSLGSCFIKGAVKAETEEIPITDERLKTAWKHNIFRTRVTFEDEIEIEILSS